jgi:hypothetical protein
MRLVWNINDCNRHDRVCHWRIYCLWHGYGGCGNTFILDKKMNAYELAEYLKAFVADKTDYDQDYLIHAAQVLILQAHEIKALREQLIELQ